MGIENIRYCEDCGQAYDIGTNIPICPDCRKKELKKRDQGVLDFGR